MPKDINQNLRDIHTDPKSFSLYSGKKVPLLIQVIASILWLAAAGLLLQGILTLLFSLVFGIIDIAIAVFVIITAKSLFRMKRSALRNSLIVAVLFVGMAIWSLISVRFVGGFSENKTEMLIILYAILLALVTFKYKNHFIN